MKESPRLKTEFCALICAEKQKLLNAIKRNDIYFLTILNDTLYHISHKKTILSFMQFLCAFMICLFLLPSCARRDGVNLTSNMVNEAKNSDQSANIDPFRARAVEIASSLDDRLLAAQILICGIDGKGQLPPHIKELLAEFPAGGVMLFRYNLDTDNDAIRALVGETVSLIRKGCDVPPFIAVDHEGGTVNRFMRGVATLPSASTYWELSLSQGKAQALEKIYADSLRAGQEIKALGINLNFAPVAEHLNDNNRVFLESRSYGPDPLFTAEAACAFVRGMEQAGVLCVIKHFPSSAGDDPHYSASAINADKAALDSLVYPFASLISIDGGARAVMAAHTLVPAVDSEIASLSSAVMEDWLRGELGFDGIIISDDFSMAAAKIAAARGTDAGKQSPAEAAVRSIAAGADMVLVWPADLRRTHGAFISALSGGQLSRERAREAASRVIYEKLKMGLINGE
jgi:beta-N-acetylhexosaminidase